MCLRVKGFEHPLRAKIKTSITSLEVKVWTDHLSGLTPELGDSQDSIFAIVSDGERCAIGSGLLADDVVLSVGWLRHGWDSMNGCDDGSRLQGQLFILHGLSEGVILEFDGGVGEKSPLFCMGFDRIEVNFFLRKLCSFFCSSLTEMPETWIEEALIKIFILNKWLGCTDLE